MQPVGRANLNVSETVAALFHEAAGVLRQSPLRSGCSVRVQAPPGARLLATGDLHDNPDHLRKIIAMARLAESPQHHVVLHELIHGERLINGMDFSYRTLARVAELVLRWPLQVHPLLANHELSQLTGKGVSKGAGNSVELFNHALEYVFGDEWHLVSEAIGDFISAMPLAVRSGSGSDSASAHSHERLGVFCAHSLPDERAMRFFDLGILDRQLVEDDFDAIKGSAYAMLWGRRYSEAQAEALAEHWNVKLIVLGHRHVEAGAEALGAHVIVLNSDHERAAVLPLDLAHVPDATEALTKVVPLTSIA